MFVLANIILILLNFIFVSVAIWSNDNEINDIVMISIVVLLIINGIWILGYLRHSNNIVLTLSLCLLTVATTSVLISILPKNTKRISIGILITSILIRFLTSKDILNTINAKYHKTILTVVQYITWINLFFILYIHVYNECLSETTTTIFTGLNLLALPLPQLFKKLDD